MALELSSVGVDKNLMTPGGNKTVGRFKIRENHVAFTVREIGRFNECLQVMWNVKA